MKRLPLKLVAAVWAVLAVVSAAALLVSALSSDQASVPGNTFTTAASFAIPVTFRSAASAGAASGVLSLTINKPAGTVSGDVMVAAVAVRPSTATITPPAGWTLVRRIDNTNANDNSLAIYQKAAGGSEPASYTWTLSASTGAAGGIQTFYGVDTSNPIDVENGQITANGLTHASPSVTTTVTNTMLVTAHAFSSAATWAPPTGMTEAYDVASVAVPQTGGISIEGNHVTQASAGATGAKTATAANDADSGNAAIVALRPASSPTFTPTPTYTPTPTFTPTSVPIAFRSAASAGVSSGNLTINKPSGTVSGDVMIASIAVRPETTTITPPSGWTLVRRMDNTNANQNSLAVYRKLAGGAEPSSYTWTISANTGAVGGILTFTGVNTSTPVNIENGQNTANALTHASPSVTTTVANTMLVTSHAFTSAATWTAPGGMTEAVDAASIAVPQTGGISLEINYVIQASAGATGTKTATASNDADVGNAHILALRP